MPSRDATTHWTGDLRTGSGNVTLDSSNAGQFPVSFPTRAGDPEGQTSPEELIAAAHSACYAMSLSNLLKKAGTPAHRDLDVSAEVTVDLTDAGLVISSVRLNVEGTVPDIDDAALSGGRERRQGELPGQQGVGGRPFDHP